MKNNLDALVAALLEQTAAINALAISIEDLADSLATADTLDDGEPTEEYLD